MRPDDVCWMGLSPTVARWMQPSVSIRISPCVGPMRSRHASSRTRAAILLQLSLIDTRSCARVTCSVFQLGNSATPAASALASLPNTGPGERLLAAKQAERLLNASHDPVSSGDEPKRAAVLFGAGEVAVVPAGSWLTPRLWPTVELVVAWRHQAAHPSILIDRRTFLRARPGDECLVSPRDSDEPSARHTRLCGPRTHDLR